jgi:hypothetical protein
MATVVRFVSGPFAGQAEATDHRFRSATGQWRKWLIRIAAGRRARPR